MGKQMGRPRKAWTSEDVDQFQRLCAIMCTKGEVCSVMGLDPRTLDKLIADHFPDTPTWEEAFAAFSAAGKASLRRAQFKLALDGDKTMLIFLGKNYLGQSEQGAKADRDEPRPSAKMVKFASGSKFARAANG